MSLCLLCPGQGGQSPAMFDRLREDSLVAPRLHALAGRLAWDPLAVAADPERCFLNRYAQPFIVLYGLAVAAALEAAGIHPAVVAGYSVGELTAHGVAGALPAEQVLALAECRAACMDQVAPEGYGMLAVRGLAEAVIAARAGEAGAVIAIHNGPDHVVLAGPAAALAALAAECRDLGVHAVSLPVSVPAHSPWLAAAVEPFTRAVAEAPWRSPRAAVLAGILARPVYTADEAATALGHQLAEPILWARTLDVAREMGATVFLDLGPGRALAAMTREHFPELPVRAVDEFASLEGVVHWLRRQR